MNPVVINDVQVCLYLNSQYSLVLSLCSSKHTFCETRSVAFKSSWLFLLDEVRQNKLEQFKRTVEDIKGGGAELLEEKNQLLQAIAYMYQ
jgi:hypothetical protein